MPDTTPSVPVDVVQAAELIHRDIAEAMDVIYGEIGGLHDTPEDVDATSKRIADDIRIVLNWVLAQAQPAPVSPVEADTPEPVSDEIRKLEEQYRDLQLLAFHLLDLLGGTARITTPMMLDRPTNAEFHVLKDPATLDVVVRIAKPATSASGEVPQ